MSKRKGNPTLGFQDNESILIRKSNQIAPKCMHVRTRVEHGTTATPMSLNSHTSVGRAPFFRVKAVVVVVAAASGTLACGAKEHLRMCTCTHVDAFMHAGVEVRE